MAKGKGTKAKAAKTRKNGTAELVRLPPEFPSSDSDDRKNEGRAARTTRTGSARPSPGKQTNSTEKRRSNAIGELQNRATRRYSHKPCCNCSRHSTCYAKTSAHRRGCECRNAGRKCSTCVNLPCCSNKADPFLPVSVSATGATFCLPVQPPRVVAPPSGELLTETPLLSQESTSVAALVATTSVPDQTTPTIVCTATSAGSPPLRASPSRVALAPVSLS